jgi:uncharacterized membrane protein
MQKEKFFYKEGRSGIADLLKGIAVIFMIQVHLTELFALGEIYYSNFGNISLFLGGPPAAPLFMIIMGYFLAAGNKSTEQLFKRGIMLFLGGILLNITLNFNLLISHFLGKPDYTIEPLQYILGADILPLAGMSFMLMAGLHNFLKRSFLLYFILAIVVVVAGSYLSLLPIPENPLLIYISAFLWTDHKWSYFPLLPWFAYPLAGAGFYYLSRKFSQYISHRAKIMFLLSWVLFLVLSIDYGINTASDLQVYYHHDIFYFIWVILFLSGFSFGILLLNKNYGENISFAYIRWIGQNVTLAYVFQWIIIGNLATVLYRTQEIEDIVFWFIGILAVVTLLIYLYRKYSSGVISNFTRSKLNPVNH